MSNNSLIGSPNRISHAKRKMPESFYRPPVQKTQLFSASEILPRSIHHSHTNSLPADVPPQQLVNLSNAHSANNLFDKSSILKPPTHMYYSPKNESPIAISPLVKSEQQYFHSKTFSLPCTFDPVKQNVHLTGNTNQSLAPPSRSQNPIGDIPLPPGWHSEKTPTGQTYFINHFLKTTTWEDPRKLYNLPMNQNEISGELRSKIARSIPLPMGWEEARTINGEVYYINHNNKTTCWEDPRINIYIHQEQQKMYASQNLNQNADYGSGYIGSNHNYQLSQPSLSSSSASINSSNNSIGSLSRSDSHLNMADGSDTYNQKLMHNFPNLTNKSAKEKIEVLKKILDENTRQKLVVCKQLDDISQMESDLKSKLSPHDLEDVLNRLKLKDSMINSFSSFETNNPNKLASFHLNNQSTPNKKQLQNEINSPLKSKTKSSDMDSTILADSCSNN